MIILGAITGTIGLIAYSGMLGKAPVEEQSVLIVIVIAIQQSIPVIYYALAKNSLNRWSAVGFSMIAGGLAIVITKS